MAESKCILVVLTNTHWPQIRKNKVSYIVIENEEKIILTFLNMHVVFVAVVVVAVVENSSLFGIGWNESKYGTKMTFLSLHEATRNTQNFCLFFSGKSF